MNELHSGGAWSFAGIIVGYLFSWLQNRDRLKFDARGAVADLQSQNAVQATQLAAQATQIATLTAALADCQRMHREESEARKASDARLGVLELKLQEK